MDREYVEEVAASLVREYLSRKGLKSTLEVMDQENPRRHCSISNRMDLMKALHIEKLMKKNKDTEDKPYKAMIEVMSKYFLEKAEAKGFSTLERPRTSRSPRSGPDEEKHRAGFNKMKAEGDLILDDNVEGETFLGDGRAGLMEKQEELNQLRMNASRPKPSSKSRGVAGPITSSLDEREKRRNERLRGPPKPTFNRLNSSSSTSSQPDTYTENNDISTTRKNNSVLSDDLIRRQPRMGLSSGLSRRTPDAIPNDVSSPPTDRRRSRHSRSSRHDLSSDEEVQDSYDVKKSSINSDLPRRTASKVSNERTNVLSKNKGRVSSRMGDIEMGDLDEVENDVAHLDVGPRSLVRNSSFSMVESKPISEETAIELKKLIFGSPNQSFNNEWRYQSFCFCDIPRLQYGIIQRKGGPCGVLAAVQACFLQQLIYNSGKKVSVTSLQPGRNERSEALALALATIFWRAGGGTKAVVCLPSMKSHFPGGACYKADQLTETLVLSNFKTQEDLGGFLRQNISQFEMDGCSGVVLTLYSVILSRTINTVIADMDEPTNTLMGAHGYCTQEMVNLLVTGRAVSNVFNDTVELDSGGVKKKLKGIHGRADVGFLSLFEHYKSCQVGTYYKTPRFPIWVICSESHFSVIFSLKKELLSNWKAEKHFDLYYYDGLGKQDQEIRLTINTTNKNFQAPGEDDLVPPIDHCVRTKWADAEVDWNGTEPLL